jgi:D-alanine transaminase
MNPDQIVYLNGEFVALADAKIPVLDRGFIYGDGVYEVIPVYVRRPFRMPQHLRRLQYSLDGIRLANPHTDAQWQRLIEDLIERQPFDDQAVYLQVTRGVAKRDHAFPAGVRPTVFMMSNPLVVPTREQVERGVAVVTAEDNRWHRCDLKTTSLLGNVLMRQLAADANAVETIMFRDGFLTEASASNVLIVCNGKVLAPPKDNLILPGITYDAALEITRAAGVPLEIRPVPKEEALGADEMWLSSSTREVLAVTTIDGRAFADGAPGPVFRRIHAAFQAAKRAGAPAASLPSAVA